MGKIPKRLGNSTVRLREGSFCNFVVKVFGVLEPCAEVHLAFYVKDTEVLWCEACGGSALKRRRTCGTTSCSSYLHFGVKSKRVLLLKVDLQVSVQLVHI